MDTVEAAGPAPQRQERRDARENRQRILEVAKQLFADRGVADTSMKEIAEAAGVGKGTLYRHFAHKGELCTALLREDVVAFQERLDALIGDAAVVASPLARLEILITERVRMTETHLPLFAAIDEATAGARPVKPFRGRFGTWTHARIVALLAEAVAQGEALPLDLEFTADALLEVMAPPLYSHQRHASGYSLERIVDGLRRLFIDGLRSPAVARPAPSSAPRRS